MSITFAKDLEALVALLAYGGYAVRAVRNIPDARGRSADVYLENGVVICWDASSCKLWISRVSSRGRRVENFLAAMCEGPRVLRVFAVVRARVHALLQSLHQSAAVWLLRSESVLARNLRQQIGRP